MKFYEKLILTSYVSCLFISATCFAQVSQRSTTRGSSTAVGGSSATTPIEPSQKTGNPIRDEDGYTYDGPIDFRRDSSEQWKFPRDKDQSTARGMMENKEPANEDNSLRGAGPENGNNPPSSIIQPR